jgi:hypothetical protein
MDMITLAMAKAYVDDTANALGAVKGSPATIESITPVDGGNEIVFSWTGADGTKQTQTMFVADGGGNVDLDTTLTKSGKAADAKAVGDAINNLSEEIDALKPEEPAVHAGVVVAFDGDKAQLVKVACEATDVIVHQGINFVPPLEKNGNTAGLRFDRTADGRIRISGTVYNENQTKTNIACYLIPYAKPVIFPAGKYTISTDLFDISKEISGASGGLLVMAKDADGSVSKYYDSAFAGKSVTFELSEPTPIIAQIRWNSVDVGTEIDTTCYAQIEMGDTASDFEPYHRNTYTQSSAEFFAYSGANIVYSEAFDPISVTVRRISTDVGLEKMGVPADGWSTGMRLAQYGKTPSDYGASGDGITDDTSAIQACIDSNAVTYFSTGKYRITAPLRIKSGKTLLGHNRENTQILCDNCDCIHFAEGAENGYIGGIAFVGDDTPHKGFVFARNVQHWTFENIIVRRFGDDFFYANNVGYVGVVQFVNSTFVQGGASGFNFICDGVSQINSIDIHGCEISHFPNGNAINVNGVRINISSNTIQSTKNGVNIQPSMTQSDIAVGINSVAVMIVSNHFEGISENCVRVVPLFEPASSRWGFVSGLIIAGNYAQHIDATTPAVKFGCDGDNQYLYAHNAPHGDALIRNLLYACNYFNVDGNVLIDGGNALQSDSLIITDSVMGDRKIFIDNETKPYSIEKIGNARVISKYEFVKTHEHVRNAYVEGTVAITSEYVTLQPDASMHLDMRRTNIVLATVPVEVTVGESMPKLTIYGQLRDGENVCTCVYDIQPDNLSNGVVHLSYDNFIKDITTDNEYPAKEFVGYTMVIEARGSTVKIGDPLVKYMPD